MKFETSVKDHPSSNDSTLVNTGAAPDPKLPAGSPARQLAKTTSVGREEPRTSVSFREGSFR